MSLADIQTSLAGSFQEILEYLNNGEIRLSSLNTDQLTDDQGFPLNEFDTRTVGFIPCHWSLKSDDDRDAGERTIAAQVRGVTAYKILIAKSYDGDDIELGVSDRLELKRIAGSSLITSLEVTAVVDDGGINWKLYAVDTNSIP